jgi:plastocyanin
VTLVRTSGAALVLLLAAAAIGLRDIEAAAMMIGALTCLALGLRAGPRLRVVGLIGLGLLSANVAVWMTPGALSNLTHGEGFLETALPSALAVVALTTLVAAAAAIRGRASGSGTGVRTAAAVALVGLIASLGASAVGAGSAARAQSGDIEVVTEHVKFLPTELTAGSGRIGVFLENRDLFWHTFTVPELDVNLNVPVGAERRIEFDAPSGTYEFVCKIPGHTQAGMKGTLTVR